MLIYLVRHAIAEDRLLTTDIPDEERRITEKGARRMRKAVVGLTVMGVEIDTIWTSPLRRARETAELLAELPTFDGDIKVVQELSPGGEHREILKRLCGVGSGIRLALVGHEPDMGLLGTQLLSGMAEDGMRFKKGGVACLEFYGELSPPRAELQWFLTPKILRSLG